MESEDGALSWRRGWAEVANEHLARAGWTSGSIRTLEAKASSSCRGGRSASERQQEPELPAISPTGCESRAIAGENGVRIIDDPGIALKAMTYGQATFTDRDLARYLNTKTDGAEQFQAVFLKVKTADELVALGRDERGETRYTTREMLGLERWASTVASGWRDPRGTRSPQPSKPSPGGPQIVRGAARGFRARDRPCRPFRGGRRRRRRQEHDARERQARLGGARVDGERCGALRDRRRESRALERHCLADAQRATRTPGRAGATR